MIKNTIDLIRLIKNQGEYLRIHLENTRLKFNDKILINKKYLSYYGIDNKSVVFCEKYYEPCWSMLFCIQFSSARTQDAITGVIDDSTIVSLMIVDSTTIKVFINYTFLLIFQQKI